MLLPGGVGDRRLGIGIAGADFEAARAVAGAIIGNNVGGGNAATGALIGGALGGTAGAIRGSNQDRNNQQRYRDSQGRYYYCYDNRQDECYWDNGTRRY